MKKLLMITLSVAVITVFGVGAIVSAVGNKVETATVNSLKVTIEQARIIALAKVPGEVEDEWEDDHPYVRYVHKSTDEEHTYKGSYKKS